jgi:CHAT domain-containing protein/tetratricopeptide (TPR) repeat protein
MQMAAHFVAADSGAWLRATLTDRATRVPAERLALLGLAALDLRSGRLSAADSGFHVLRAGRADDALGRCVDLGAAMVLAAQGQWGAATAAFTDVAAAARTQHDSLVEAEALLGLVGLESRGRADAAAAHLARADSIIAPTDIVLRATALCVRASLLSAIHAPGVPAAAAEGAALARQGGDPMVAAGCEFAAAANEALQGAMESASHHFGTVVTDAHQANDVVLEAIALQWRGYVRLALGKYASAREDLDRALVLAQATGALSVVGWSELNLAALFGSLGDWPTDRRHAARAHAVLASIGDSAGLGILRRGEGQAALEVGDTAGARASFQVAAAAAEHTGRVADIVAARTALADLAVREGRFDVAAALLHSEYALLAGAPRSGWELLLPWKEARLAIARRDWTGALSDLAAARPALDSSQHLFRYQLREDQAQAELGAGDTSRAIATLGQADEELDRWRATLGTEDLRVLAFQSVDVIGGESGDAASVTAAAARTGRIATAFALAERRRGRDLADQLRRADALRQRGSPGDEAGDHGRAFGDAAPMTLLEVERAIPDDSTAILEYVTGTGQAPTTFIIITRHGARAALLAPADSLTDAIARYDALVDQDVGAAAPARQLGAALLAPALAGLPSTIRRLIIIPDGVLNRVAFGSLRLEDGRPLLARAAIAIAPSAAVLMDLWRRSPRDRPAAVLAFGDPVLPHEETAATDTNAAFDAGAAAGLDATGQLPRLPWTADEARVVGAFASRAVVRLRGDASAAYLERTPLDDFSIIHFATHAVIDEDFPLGSALVLAPGGGASSFVGPGELGALHLTADIVVLSACRTARGPIVEGEGVRGLIAPILAAGARSVLATRWRLDDRAAVPLVYAVYQGLAAGLPVSEAVRRAELAAFHRGAPEREWAVFILVGDPLVRVPLHLPLPERVPEWLR